MNIRWIALVLIASVFADPAQATNWSTQTHDLYPGDFDGDGRDDLLVIAKDPNGFSGIFTSGSGQPSTQLQSWNSGFLGINWHSGAFTAVVGDFDGNGRADVLLQSSTSGNSYLLKTNSEGKLFAIHQVIGGWGQSQYRIIAGKFNADARADVFLQSKQTAGTNYIIVASTAGLLTTTAQSWPNDYLGFKWSTQNALVHAGDFNGDGRDDLLVQAKPGIVLVDFDISIPIPFFKPQSFGLTLSSASGQFTAIQQLWSQKDFGVDWSPNIADLVIGDVNGDGRDDVAVVARGATQSTYIMLTTVNGQVSSSPAQTLTSGSLGTNWNSAEFRMLAADFNGDGRAEIYQQSTSGSGTNSVVSFSSGGTASSAASHNAPSVTNGLSLAIGRIPGDFAVSPGGSATYTIPIEVPIGTGGLKPALALSYNSGSGSGLLGVGWDISGRSEMSRCGRTIVEDGETRAVDRSANDRFCIDGNKLRVTNGGTYGANGTTYQTEIETFARVTSYTSGGDGAVPSAGPQYFKVESKDGLYYYYGKTVDSRIEVKGTTVPRAWALNRVEDRNGNYLTIAYTKGADSSGVFDGSYRPASIQWTLTAAGTGPYFKASFFYEARPASDVDVSYFAGGSTTEDQRLDRLDVEAYENGTWSLVRRYDATYESSTSSTGSSRLASIKLCSATECLPATTFNYQSGTPGWSAPSTYFASTTDSMPYAHAIDIDGDGISDLVYPKSNYWYFRRWDQTANTYTAETNSFIGTGTGTTAAYLTAKPISLTEGGKAGLLVRMTSGNAAVLAWSGSALLARSTTLSSTLLDKKNWIGDFDGDGRDDFLYLEQSGATAQFWMLKATGTVGGSTYDFTAATSIATLGNYGTLYDLGQADRNAALNDFNGDGKTDIFFWTDKVTNTNPSDYLSYVETTEGKLLLSTGTTFTQQTIWSCQIGGNDYITGHGCGSPNPVLADFNGDGLTDILYTEREYTSTRRMAFGSGNGLSSAVAITSTASGSPIDYDNDGRADLLTTNGYIFRFNGTGFDAAISVGINSATVRIIDLNGDGLQDVGYFSNNNWVGQIHSGISPDLLTRVTDGYGNYAAPTYASLTDTTVYTKGAAAQFPVIDIKVPQTVVKNVSSSSGVETPASYAVKYSYSGLRAHLQGRGVLGFEKRTVTDTRPGNEVKVEETYSQAFPFVGMTIGSIEYQPNSVLKIAEKTVTPAMLTLDSSANNQRYFPYAQTVVDDKREVSPLSTYNGSLITRTTTTSAFDNYGNQTNQMVTVADMQADSPLLGAVYTVVAIITPDISDSTLVSQLTSNWCIGSIKSEEIRSTPYGETAYKSRLTEHQYDFSKCRVTKDIVEPNNPGGNTKVTTDFAYYPSGPSVGQILSKTVTGVSPAPFAAPAVRSETYEYDPAGMYVTKATNTLGQFVTSQWRIGLGVEKRRVDVNGNAVDYTHDSFGRVIRENRPDGTQTDYVLYDCPTGCGYATGKFQSVALSSGGGATIGQSAVIYDAMERELQATRWKFGGAQSHVLTEYDLMGRVKRTSAPLWTGGQTFWSTTSYDLLNRPIDGQQPISDTNAALQTVHWDYKGLQTIVTDPEGKATTRWVNAIGKLVKTIDAAGGATLYGYDHFGGLIRTQDPAGNVASGQFDDRGRKKVTSDPDLGDWAFTYDSLGELLKQKDAKLQDTTLTYDAVGRMKTRTEAEGSTTFNYDTAAHGVGMLASVSSPNGYAENHYYDALGRPSDVMTTIDAVNYTVSTSYNAQGQVDTLTYPESYPSGNRFKIKYVYEAGMMKRIEDANGASTAYWTAIDTNAAGAVVAEVLGNGVATSTAYDQVNGQLLNRYSGPGYDGSVQSLQYKWDRAGNLTQRKDVRAGSNLVEDFYYDTLNRLDYSKLNGVQNLDLQYDAIGNVLQKSDVSGSNYVYGAQQAGCSYYSYAQPHAVRKAGAAVYCYDKNGNMSNRDGSALDWYSYNLPKKLRKGANSSEFFYAADRSRYKTLTVNGSVTETTVSVGALFERVSKTSDTVIEYKHYLPGLDGAVAIVTRRSNSINDVRYLHKDQLGSVDAITNESGTVVVRLSYDAFGKRRNPGTWNGVPSAADWTQINAVTHQAFTSHEQLDAIDLIHMKGRVYDPSLGRFLSADPMINGDGDSQGLNRYSYVRNSPLSMTDPTGYSWFSRHLNPFKQIKTLLALHAFSSPFVQHAFMLYKANQLQDKMMTKYPWYGTVSVMAACYWGGPWGCAGANAHLTRLQGGSLEDIVRAGVSSFITSYVGSYYGNTYSWTRVAVEGVAGGVASEIRGGTFIDGFKMSAGFALVSYGAYSMRQAMIDQSCTPPGNPNCTGVSAGAYGDAKKVGGGRMPFANEHLDDPWTGVDPSPLGGNQGGIGQIFGHTYTAGSLFDRVIEAYAGPHDFLSSFRYGFNGDLIAYTKFGRFAYEVYSFAALVPATPLALTALVPSYVAIPALTRDDH